MSGDVATLNISVARGSAKTYNFTHQTSGSNTAAVNITGWTITVTVRNADGSLLFTKTASVVSGAAGTYTWSVTKANTNVTPTSYPMDIWRTDSGSETLMGVGQFTITPEVLN